MMKQFKENSHQKIEDIKKQQAKHKKDLIQPRDENREINEKYLMTHGTKNLNVSEYDINRMAKKDRRFLKILNNKRKQQNGN